MSDWKVIVPSGSAVTNVITNPAAFLGTTGFSIINGTETLTQSSTQHKFGPYSVRLALTADAAQEGVQYAQTAGIAASTEYTISAWVRASDACDVELRARNQANDVSLAISRYSLAAGTWTLTTVTFTSDAGQTTLRFRVTNTSVSTAALNVDGCMCVLGSDTYTYIDGEQPGCEWNGTRYASTSTLSASSRAGGIVEDLEDEYDLFIEGVLGAGMTARITSRDGYGQLPGGALNASVRSSRTMTLTGLIHSTSQADLHDKRKALVDLFNPEAYPATADGWQPVRLQYTGGTTSKEIAVHYEAGLEGDRNYTMPFNERVALRFYAPDPNWYEIGDTVAHLDSNDTATLRYVAGRLKSTGQWDDLG